VRLEGCPPSGSKGNQSGDDLLLRLLARHSVKSELLKLARDDVIDVKAVEVAATPAGDLPPRLDVKAGRNVNLVQQAALGGGTPIPHDRWIYPQRREVTPQYMGEDERPQPAQGDEPDKSRSRSASHKAIVT
jgi:hypothetical protein